MAVSLPNLSVLVDVTAQCSFMNPSQRLLLVAAGGGQMCGWGPQKEAGGGFPSDKRGVLVCWLYKSVCITAATKDKPRYATGKLRLAPHNLHRDLHSIKSNTHK